MNLVRTFADARRRYKGRVALVPTMGYFHEGHLALMQVARAAADTVVVSHFVNPLQFTDPADLDRYPRDLNRDLDLVRPTGIDVVFAPHLEEIYPPGARTTVTVEGAADWMEGRYRPGHFVGVATVVAKLFAGLRPNLSYFGRKDAQQLALIRRMAIDLAFPTSVLGHPTIREKDGLALSSRNVLLEASDRPAALLLSKGLMAAADRAEAGDVDGRSLIAAVRSATDGLPVDYVELASQEGAEGLAILDRPAFLAAAVHVGGVRLIDNVSFDLVAGQVIADRGVRLDHPSMVYG
ncbi:MAG: pantoate--beta-alanine ligase [Actinomycetota bacterium]